MAGELKVYGGALMKAAGDGTARAIFSRYNVIDHDGDVTLPGAFVDGTEVFVSPWNHSSVITGALPAGKGVIRTTPDYATVDVEFFLGTAAGRETWLTLKELGGSEWSYAFNVIDAADGEWNGRRVRILKKLDPFEASPVAQGAGVRTETVSVRSRLSADQRAVVDAAQRHVAEHQGRETLQRAFLTYIASGLES